MSLTNIRSDRKPILVAIAALTVALFALSITLWIYLKNNQRAPSANAGPQNSALSRIKSTHTLRVAYAGFPPYTIVDPKESDPSKRVSGFAVDMVDEIAKRSSPPLQVVWSASNFDTLKADIDSGRIDFVADAVYHTVPRAADFGLTRPYSYFGVAVALVRKDDNRFHQFSDLDRPDITIALAAGWTSTDYAQQHLIKPKFKLVTVSDNAYSQLDEVLFGRADVALQDVPTVIQYVRAHPDQVKGLWISSPPSTVPGGFLTRQGDEELLNFLNGSIGVLQADGTIDKLDKKWHSLGYFERPTMVPGDGLKPSGK